jgi:hypothetical protein
MKLINTLNEQNDEIFLTLKQLVSFTNFSDCSKRLRQAQGVLGKEIKTYPPIYRTFQEYNLPTLNRILTSSDRSPESIIKIYNYIFSGQFIMAFIIKLNLLVCLLSGAGYM